MILPSRTTLALHSCTRQTPAMAQRVQVRQKTARPGPAAPGTISEGRAKINAIYAALVSRNFKQARKLVDAALNKHPGHPSFLALRALVLHSTGQGEQAKAVLESLQGDNLPTDESSVSTLQLVYKELGLYTEARQLTEQYANANPNDEEAAASLFHAYVREFNYVKQQQQAMRLYKTTKRRAYYFWSIISTLMQVKQGDASASRQLSLCEMMLNKALAEKLVQTSEEVWLMVDVLRRQSKFTAALELLGRPEIVELFKITTDRTVMLAELHVLAGLHQQAAKLWAQLLREHNPDDWAYWLGLFDSVAAISSAESSDAAEFDKLLVDTIQHAVAEEKLPAAESTAVDVSGKYPTKRNRRGPFLAEIEYASRVGDTARVADLLVAYFQRYGARLCAHADMRPYLHHVAGDAAAFAARIAATIEAPAPGADGADEAAAAALRRARENYVHRVANRHQLEHTLGLHRGMARDTTRSLVSELVQAYQSSLEIGSKYEDRDFGHGDDLMLLAAHILARRDEASLQDLLDASLLLEAVLRSRRWNYQCKLFLFQVYCRLGGFKPGYEYFDSLDIKGIQWDTVSYLAIPQAVRACCPEELTSMLAEIEGFHAENQREQPEHCTGPYREESYSKVKELADFHHRLKKSLPRAQARVEHAFLCLNACLTRADALAFLNKSDSLVDVAAPAVEPLCGNSDYTAMIQWDAPATAEEEAARTAAPVPVHAMDHAAQKQWLQLRGAVPVVLAAALATPEERAAMADDKTGAMLNQVQQMVLQLRLHVPSGEPESVAAFPALQRHIAVTLAMLQLTEMLARLTSAPADATSIDEALLGSIETAAAAVTADITVLFDYVTQHVYLPAVPAVLDPATMPHATLLVSETAMIAGLLLDTWLALTPVPKAKRKKNADASVTPMQAASLRVRKAVLPLRQALLDALASLGKEYSAAAAALKPADAPSMARVFDADASAAGALASDEELKSSVFAKLVWSHKVFCANLTDRITARRGAINKLSV